MNRIILITFILLNLNALASPTFIDSRTSESGKLKISKYRDEEKNQNILLLDTPTQKGVLLYAYDRSIRIKFSPDDMYIVLDDECFSNASDLIFFRRGNDSKYSKLNTETLRGRVLDKILADYNLPKEADFFHFYLVSRDWNDDHTINIRAWGYGKSGTIDNWICSYNILDDKIIVSPETMKDAKYEKPKS